MNPQTATAAFPSAATSVAAARRFVRSTLTGWGLEEIADDAVLATSELATNAVTYAGTSFEVGCRLEQDGVQIELRDHHATRRLEMPGGDETRGRGLASTARLASRWGVTYEREAKTVWFRLAAPAEGAPPPTAVHETETPSGAHVLPPPGRVRAGGAMAHGATAMQGATTAVGASGPAGDRGIAPAAGTSGAAGMVGAAGMAAMAGLAGRAGRAGGTSTARGAGLAAGAGMVAAGRAVTAASAVAATDGDALDRAAETARDVLAADGAAILLADADGRFTVGAATGLATELDTAYLRVEDLGKIGGTEYGQADQSAWVPAEEAALPPLARLLGARSFAAARVRLQGWTAGVVLAVAATGHRFDPAAGVRLTRIADEVALTLERARVGELERSWRGWLSFVAEASDLLAGTLDQERTMALVAQLAVPRLASWCAVYTLEDTGGEPGKARAGYVWHADETRTDALRDLLAHADPPPSAEVTGPWNGFSGAPAGARAAAGSLADDVVYAFPLIARGRRIGLILIGRPAGDRFPRGMIDLADELSRRAALAIDNARLYAAQTTMSNALQRSLLPPDLPEVPGLEVAVVYEPAGGRAEVGGDFYDVFEAPPDDQGLPTWRFAIGDVCGTGPEAAAVTGLARQALRILAAEGMSVPDVLARLNRLILGEGARSRLLTLLHGAITPRPDRRGVRLRLVSAGHPLPLVLSPDGTVTEVATPQGLLGVFDDAEFGVDDLELAAGQVLLCVTDGVTERRFGQRLLGDGKGLERLLSTCAGLSAGAVAAKVQRAVRDFGPEPSNDDVALIVLRVP